MTRVCDLLAPAVLCLAAILAAPGGRAADNPCLECHAKVLEKPFVHPAAQKRCTKCHNDAKPDVPHDAPDAPRPRKPEDSSKTCVGGCHEAEMFEGKFVHAPVNEGKCVTCHNPHSSDNVRLLNAQPAALCLDCHASVKGAPHMVSGFSQRSHPLGDGPKQVDDPSRPGTPFYCAACHEPHRSEHRSLLRWDPAQLSCQTCHQM